jgi:hypothetical protein
VFKLFLIIAPIISDLESVCYSRFGSQKLAKERDTWTWAAGDEKVSYLGFHLRRSNDLLGVLVRKLFLIISPIISDLESVCYSRFGSQELVNWGSCCRGGELLRVCNMCLATLNRE